MNLEEAHRRVADVAASNGAITSLNLSGCEQPSSIEDFLIVLGFVGVFKERAHHTRKGKDGIEEGMACSWVMFGLLQSHDT
jgi:hypothetical protein